MEAPELPSSAECILNSSAKDHVWTEAQLHQLRAQNQALQQLLAKGEVDPDLIWEMKLGSFDEQMALVKKERRRVKALYDQKFGANLNINACDLFEYVERKLAAGN